MKVVSYLKTVPAGNRNMQKPELLRQFVNGVNAAGDIGILHDQNNLLDCDVGMIQGWVYDKTTTEHLRLRKTIIKTQKLNKKHSATADANLFLYHDKTNPHGYLRYSFDGVFPRTGQYCDSEIDPTRWLQISKDTGINLQPYKTTGGHIVLMLQRNGGWSMGGLDVETWAISTIANIRRYTDRHIIIRSHPGDRFAKTYLKTLHNKLRGHHSLSISRIGTPYEKDMQNAWAVVNHNSSAAVGPIINGYHCFLTDPKNSQCAEVSNTDFKHIEKPLEYDREKWLQRISMMHWKFSELTNGTCWRHMRQFIS
jgi:hypothetical protein